MALTPGTRLGPYEVTGSLGAGGMGVVYRARDTRLNREVAIKVLPDLFAADPERLARFEREAQVLAALNHPNIAHIHGLEDSAGTRALVMELVEGEDLAQRLDRGPIPLDEALAIATQIVDALEAAHEQGIVHRDLKPANIKVRTDGTVKVLDFGLAKAMEMSDVGATQASPSPLTVTSPAMTAMGMVLGTAAYMAPEQARGKTVDKRADIWAFGVVLYEMLTGQRLFQGDTVSDSLAAVLTRDPDWTRVPIKVLPLLRQCLERDPKRRLRDIGDARFLLDAPAPAQVVARPSKAPWVIAAVLFMGLLGALIVLWPRPVDRPVIRLDVDLGSDAINALSVAAVSPDGTRLVFPIRGSDGRQVLATRQLDQGKLTPLAGTEGGDQPFFSPDGQWVGFFSAGKLKKVSVQGGTPVVLADASNPRGAAWTEDGSIVAALINTTGLWRVPSDGGPPEALTKLTGGEPTHRWPQMLPGSRAVLFTAHAPSLNSYEGASIDVQSLDTGERKTLWRGGYHGRYLPTSATRGHLVFVHEGVLFGVPFDPVRLEIEGTPAPLLEDMGSDAGSAAGRFDASRTGLFVYRTGTAPRRWPVVWLDSSGKTQPLLAKPGNYTSARFSPDGQRLAISMDEGKGSDIFVYDSQRDTMPRVTFTAATNSDPVWAPGGTHIAFRSLAPDNWILWWIRADGSGEAQRLFDKKNTKLGDLTPNAFSPDGRRLIYAEEHPTTRLDLWVLPLDLSDPDHPKPGEPEPFLRTPFNEERASLSPDGRWVAYTSDELGTSEVFVQLFSGSSPGRGGRWQISTTGGTSANWSRNGRDLFYETPDNRIMVTEYSTKGDSFVAGKPRLWSQTQIHFPGFTSYDVAPDGKRIATFPRADAADASQPPRVTFLLNFFDEVRRRLP